MGWGVFALPTAVDVCLFAMLNLRKKSEKFAEKTYWHPMLFFSSSEIINKGTLCFLASVLVLNQETQSVM